MDGRTPWARYSAEGASEIEDLNKVYLALGKFFLGSQMLRSLFSWTKDNATRR